MKNQIDNGSRFIPSFIYGTAWKEDETSRLTELALLQGFRGMADASLNCNFDRRLVGEILRSVCATVDICGVGCLVVFLLAARPGVRLF
jgi:hypothetical protein